jgi:hypothetical protein
LIDTNASVPSRVRVCIFVHLCPLSQLIVVAIVDDISTISCPAVYAARQRSLEHAVGAVVQYKAVEWVEQVDAEPVNNADRCLNTPDTAIPSFIAKKGEYKKVVEEHELEMILGIAWWDGEQNRA